MSAQTNQGAWQTPFNHVVPSSWVNASGTFNGWTKDGEPLSPYVSIPPNPARFMAAHMALIPKGTYRGQVLVWNMMRPNNSSFAAGINTQYWSIMNPTATPPTFLNNALVLPAPPSGYKTQDLYCAGHSWNSRGELFVVGGNRWQNNGQLWANTLAYTFDPLKPFGKTMWIPENDISTGRWYPTVTTMATDSTSSQQNPKDPLMVSGGFDLPMVRAYKTYETFWPQKKAGVGAWESNPAQPLPHVGFPKIFSGPSVLDIWQLSKYPRNIMLSSGRIFTAGMGYKSYRVMHDNVTQTTPPVWQVMSLANQTYLREYGSAVLFPNLGGSNSIYKDLVLRIGGVLIYPGSGTASAATNTVEYCYAGSGTGSPNWTWQSTASMTYARVNTGTVILPDATILVVGGKTDVDDEFTTSFPVLQAELFNDSPFAWRTLASMQTRRGYHSAAILLPDGKVLVGGGEQRERDYEIFHPPYMTNGTVRPTILNAPATLNMGYGQTLSLQYQTLPMGIYVEKVVLMAPASMTHHSDMHARYIELDIDNDVLPPFPPPPNPVIYFKAPASSKLAPKGYYMVFLVTNGQGVPKGTPSVATWALLL